MRRSAFSALIGGILLLLLSACGSTTGTPTQTVAAKKATTDCLLTQFKAAIFSGPDTGMALQGNLTLHLDNTGAITGVLQQGNQSQVHTVGQSNGRAINLLFDIGQGKLVYGVGTLQNPLQICNGAVGGPLVGPNEKDSGSWASAKMCTLLASINCTAIVSSQGNPDFVAFARACCK